MSSLKDKIKGEMISDYSNALERNFELAKSIIKITPTGKIEILEKDKFSGEELILLYLIGKKYAYEAEISSSFGADNQELIIELGKPSGSIFPWLKNLRQKKKIIQDKNKTPIEHYIAENVIEVTLKELSNK